jgi:hypothetical protein
MTYPASMFLGETGEISATYRPADHAPELTEFYLRHDNHWL